MKRLATILLILLLAWPAAAQDGALQIKGDIGVIEIDEITIVKKKRALARTVPFTLIASPGAADYRWVIPANVLAVEGDDGALKVTSAPKGELTISCRLLTVDFEHKITKRKTESLTFNVGDVPQPIPPPPPVPPVPPTPPPQPVTSFRVIMVFESADTLVGWQNSVIYGKAVEDFLNATCTGGKAGWRRRDKDLGGENDPTMQAIWSVVQKEFAPPKNTKTPAVAVQVNEKIEIIPLAATPAEMVAVLKKYAEGK